MTDTQTTSPPASLAQLSSRLVDDVRDLDAELAEVDLLVEQAKTEAARHVGAPRGGGRQARPPCRSRSPRNATELLEQSAQLVTLTKRAALMESQVDVLEGKRRALGRYRDAVAEYATLHARTSAGARCPGGDAVRPRRSTRTPRCRRPSRDWS